MFGFSPGGRNVANYGQVLPEPRKPSPMTQICGFRRGNVRDCVCARVCNRQTEGDVTRHEGRERGRDKEWFLYRTTIIPTTTTTPVVKLIAFYFEISTRGRARGFSGWPYNADVSQSYTTGTGNEYLIKSVSLN